MRPSSKHAAGKEPDPHPGIHLPENRLTIREGILEGKNAFVVLNRGLEAYPDKARFGWTCIVSVTQEGLPCDGMPVSEETEWVFNWLEALSGEITGDPYDPDGLFLARIGTEGGCRLVWQLRAPGPAETLLQRIASEGSCPCTFDYRLQEDAAWENAALLFRVFGKQ